MTNFTPTTHKGPYDAISAAHADLSQVGRTVLITGGSKGIGFAIARAFAIAGVTRVILVARGGAALDMAVLNLESEFQATVIPITCDIGDPTDIEALWAQLNDRQIAVDVLVLNAACVQAQESSMLGLGWQKTWQLFETNVRGNMILVEKMMSQADTKQKVILNVSSPFIHDQAIAAGFQAYASSKSAFASALQHLATETPLERAQIISFHPGFIYSEGMRSMGCTHEDLDWDDEELPANFAVWAASPKAAFLHGRFAWAKWNVEEIADAVQTRHADILRIGVHGL
ncbi:hypothetical protein N7468_000781 [Penicillium chermesinum]|uniref:Ketoreductase domain-containing protein n=1 Tax=Penicillium chermesinum TaxID=63820 RepID=A0A9W9TWR3_9EURO|nr:uncharacterized protein N7468_000781 [Penicillium chermesinum]KAJ5245798.1 hypothetical protein N7468_000781 [Penicillium chermesinum]KAJ6144099.1 hypothetical protein N7470_007994 [Penicillium chermesinum]